MKHPMWTKKAGCALLFAVLAAVLCAAFNFLFTDDIHALSRVTLQEMYAQAGQIDTLFLGSSHCYHSFDPALVDERLGTHSFNAGTSQQLPDGSYWLLREAAAENELDTVYLEVFYSLFNESGSRAVPQAAFLITDYMRPASPNRYAYLWEMGGLAALPDLLLPARHNIAEPGELRELWKAKLTDGYTPGNYSYLTYPDEVYAGNGFVKVYGVARYGFDTILNVNANAPLSDFGWEYLRRITDFCQKQGIRLVLVTAPLPSAYAANTENYQAFVDAVRAFSANQGIDYWDFTLFRDVQDLPLTGGHFADAHHLNAEGAQLFTEAFCRVAAQSAAGQDTAPLFYETLAQKLAEAPDGTMTGAAG